MRDGTFTHNVQRFVKEQLNLPGTFVITSPILSRLHTLNVLLAGQPLMPTQLHKTRTQLPRYCLAGARLTIRQGLLTRLDLADTQPLRSSELEDVRSRQEQTRWATKSAWRGSRSSWSIPTAPRLTCPVQPPCCARCR